MFMKEVTMSSKKNEIPPPPGFPRPLAEISPTGKAGERTFLDKRRNLRQRDPPNISVPTHSRISPRAHGQGLRRGPGRPRKNRSDDVVFLSTTTKESLASEPSRRGLGRPRRKRSDVTEAPAVSPPLSLGSMSDTPPEINSDEVTSDEVTFIKEETMSNAKLSRLMHPPETNHSSQILDEETERVIVKVECFLVKKLLTSANDVDSMVHQANTTFGYLKGFGVDYGSFYGDIREYIKCCCNLQDAEREEAMSSLSALLKNYENATVTTNDVAEDVGGIKQKREMAKKKKETLKRQIEDLKTEVAQIDHEEERLKHDEIKYKEAHEAAKAKMQELGTQLEEAQAKLRDIERRKNAALRGIESITQRLQSRYLDDLD